MNAPSELIAGDSATWLDDPFTDSNGKSYDSGSYTLKYVIAGPGAPLTLTATANGRGWSTTISTTQSAALAVGTTDADGNFLYGWTAQASKAGERVTAGNGRLLLHPDLSTAVTAYNPRTQAETALATVRAAISARASGDLVTKYMIGNRSLEKEPMAALLDLESHYVRVVRRERGKDMIANGLGNPRRVMVKFAR